MCEKCTVLCFVVAMVTSITGSEDEGYRLQHPRSHVIVAPASVRPGQVYQVHISVLSLQRAALNIRASIRRDGQEVTSLDEGFTQPSTRLAQMQVPEYAEAGNYTLLIKGYTDGMVGSVVFRNESRLYFSPKQVSVFIQTHKPIYGKRDYVYFRIIAVRPNQLPVTTGSIDIYIKDGEGQIIRRWLSQQVYQGYYEGNIQISYTVKFGLWTINVKGWGHNYQQQFYVENYFYSLFDVNVTVPTYIYDKDFGLGGTFTANYTKSGLNIKGNATVELEIQKPGIEEPLPRLSVVIPTMCKVSSFLFRMEDIKAIAGDVKDVKLVVHASVFSWPNLETRTMTGTSYILSHAPRMRILGGRIRVFKPEVEFIVHIAVFLPDGGHLTSHTNRLVLVQTTTRLSNGETLTEKETTKIIPEPGIITHKTLPHPDAEKITVRAEFSGVEGSTHEVVGYRHYTRSNDYLKLSLNTEDPAKNQYLVFTTQCTTVLEEITYIFKGTNTERLPYANCFFLIRKERVIFNKCDRPEEFISQISSSGNIISAGSVSMNTRQKTFSVAASRDMVPEARMLVYGIRNDGEILADSVNFHIEGINDKVRVRVNKGKNFNLDTIEVSGESSPGAFIAFSAEQYSLWKHDRTSFINRYKVENDLLEYEPLANTSFRHTWYHEEGRREDVWFPAPSYAPDANTTFAYSGLLVYTDATLTRIPNAADGVCNQTRGFLPCMDGSCYLLEQQCDGVWQCEDGADELGCTDPQDDQVTRPDAGADLERLYLHNDDTSWAWKNYITKPDGRIDQQFDLPLRPVTWLLSAVSLSKEEGLAFSEHPVRLDSTRPVFITLEGPESAYKGEQIGMQVSVNNEKGEPLEVILTLEENPDYRFVNVEPSGLVSSYRPRTSAGSVQTLVYLLPGDSTFVHFPILPLITGEVSVTVQGTSFVNSHRRTHIINIKMNGVTNRYHTPYLVDLISSGSMLIPNLEIPVPERFVYPGQREHLYVPGSQSATVSVVGDVVGTGFETPHLMVGEMIGISYGKGEDHIQSFGINLYWIRFLKVANHLSKSTLDAALTGMSHDVQECFSYVQSDGGLAQRRSTTPSDMWLTSLTLGLLSQAVEPEYEHILFIDLSVLSNMADFLCNHQNSTTGEFYNIAPVYGTTRMFNGTDDDVGNAILTAQVTISLSYASNILDGDVRSRTAQALTLAGGYLSRIYASLTDSYQVTMVTYALHVLKLDEKNAAFLYMKSIRREGENVYWSRDPIPPLETVIIDTKQYLQPRPLPTQRNSKAIAATSYALLTYLYNNYYTEAVPIMEWLQTQRNSVSGFDSGQDTLLATQALTEFGIMNPNRGLYSIQLGITATSSPSWVQKLFLHEDSLLTETKLEVPHVFGSIQSAAQGTGTALLQMSTRVNVEYPHQMRQYSRSFDLEVETLRFTGRNSSIMEMNVCIRWVATDIAPRSGAVTLEIDIPTGFFVRKQQLRLYQRVGRIDSHTSRFSSQKVIMCMDYIDPEGACWYFPAERWYPVANTTIQHRIRVYESDELGNQNNTMYTTFNLFTNHICMVCGSFQCPYCPYYNQSYKTKNNPLHLILSVIISIYLFYFHSQQ